MSIYVGIIVEEQSRDISPDNPTLLLENDGYYWYLYPLFEELYKSTGQFIDVYGNAIFTPLTLPFLQKTISTAREQIKQHPKATWQVHTRTLLPKTPEEQEIPIYSVVEKSLFLKLLDALDEIIVSAQQQQKPIRFEGD